MQTINTAARDRPKRRENLNHALAGLRYNYGTGIGAVIQVGGVSKQRRRYHIFKSNLRRFEMMLRDCGNLNRCLLRDFVSSEKN